ncbi:hypothetical protein [Pedobacter miscanthi]|jgi:hypothetical protein|uniref:hypothetical protein n=1 Tax=Pedobacter miscanthi TaxID=2259170 RepID=UPI00292CADDC|nr:hypothetical protein [Pedobacter miscanthi]
MKKENYSDQEWEVRKVEEVKLWLFYFLQVVLLITVGAVAAFSFNKKATDFQIIVFFLTLILMFTPFWKTKIKASLRGEGILTAKNYRFFLNSFYIVWALFVVSQAIYWIKYLYK